MNTFGSTISKVNPKNVLGGILGSFEEDFEREASSTAQNITKGVGGVFEAILSLGQDVTGAESQKETSGSGKFPTKGSIEFNQAVQKEVAAEQKKKEETSKKRIFFQTLKEDKERTQRAKEKLLFEEEINDIAINLPTEQKNQLLGYQASYRDGRNVYQRAELRKKLIEQRKKSEKQEKETSASKNPAGFSVGENGLLMGGERSGGGHWSTTPG